jgi:hypothetical protein
MGYSRTSNPATSSKPIVGPISLISSSAVLVEQPYPHLTPLTPHQPFLSLILSVPLAQNIHNLLSIGRKIHAFTTGNKHPKTMETLVEFAAMKDVREELIWKIQCELDVAWTNARFLAPNPALEGRVPKHEFNSKLGTIEDTNFNKGKAANEPPRIYIEGDRKRKAKDEGCISLPVGEQQPTKKAKKDVTRKGKGKKPKKLEKAVEYTGLEDEHDEGGWQCGGC